MIDPILKEAKISGLPRGLHDGKVLLLKSVNYLFGPNGSGKSLVIKSIAKQAKKALIEGGKNADGYFAQYITASPQQPLYQDSYMMLEQPASQVDLQNDEIAGQTFFQHLEDYPEIRIKIRDALQKYLGRYPNMVKRGVQNVMSFLREEEPDDPGYSPQNESDGLRRLSLLLTYIYHPKCLFLAVDEPELYLHPDMISFLLEEVQEEIIYGKQFVFATHSPEMIRVGNRDKYTYACFNLKDKLKDTTIIQASENGADAIIESLGVLLDVNKRAFLFAPITVLVEGLNDEYVFSKLKEKGKVDWGRRVFMVDVGGHSNMFNFWMLWRKFQKDCRVILDSPKTGKEKEFENIIVNPFCAELGIDQGLSFDEKKKRLDDNNIFIAQYDDVLLFGAKRVSRADVVATLEQLDTSVHVEVLTKAVKTNEKIKKVLRTDERQWLIEIAQEVHRHFYNGGDPKDALNKAEGIIHSQHPTVEITRPTGVPDSLLEAKFRVSKDRTLSILICNDVTKTHFEVS